MANEKQAHIISYCISSELLCFDKKLTVSKYNKEKDAIVIPETGVYFIYVRITLSCHVEDGTAKFKKFDLALHKWNEG